MHVINVWSSLSNNNTVDLSNLACFLMRTDNNFCRYIGLAVDSTRIRLHLHGTVFQSTSIKLVALVFTSAASKLNYFSDHIRCYSSCALLARTIRKQCYTNVIIIITIIIIITHWTGSFQCGKGAKTCRRVTTRFYPRDAMLARVIAIATCLSVRPSVCHAPVLCHDFFTIW